MIVKTGCCGFPVSRKKYYEKLSLVELQNTFYNLPTIDWAEKIRREAPEKFEFTVKAWQVITHPYKSPTWRRLRRKPEGGQENYGWLRPTKENLEAFKKTLEISRRLKAKIIVLQTPPSMPFNNESIKWVNQFFKEASSLLGKDEYLGWEPRGEWAKSEVLGEILHKYRVIHVVDIFKHRPVCMPDKILYIRLHGIGREVNYKYKYSDEDLDRLVELISAEEPGVVYVLFNNIYMFDDALRFREVAVRRGLNVI